MASPVESGPGTVQDSARDRGYGRLFLDAAAEAILNTVAFVFHFLWWSVKWSLAACAIIAVMAGAGYYVLNKALAGGEYVTVPNIVHLSLSDAQNVLVGLGLELGKRTDIENDRVPPNHVVSQRPEAGKVVRAGRTVYPTVSIGPTSERAPSFVALTLEEARNALAESSYQLGAVSRIPNRAEVNTVIAQDPPAGARIRRGGEVNLLVSNGPTGQMFIMPDITGKPVAEAVDLLAKLDVAVEAVQARAPDAPVDVVLEQSPEPGTWLAPGQRVTYKAQLSSGAAALSLQNEVNIRYLTPPSASPRHVRVDFIDKNGVRSTMFDKPDVAGQSEISIPGVRYDETLTVEFYIDGVKERSYFYAGKPEPVVTQHRMSDGGLNAAT